MAAYRRRTPSETVLDNPNRYLLFSLLSACAYSLKCCVCLQEKNYAFVEFRNVEEASNLMAFDGLVFKDCYLRVWHSCPQTMCSVHALEGWAEGEGPHIGAPAE